MLRIETIRQDPGAVTLKLLRRGVKNAEQAITDILHVDEKRRKQQALHDKQRQDVKELSAQIGRRVKVKENAEDLKEQSRVLGGLAGYHGEQARANERAIETLLYRLPNLPQDNVPDGAGPEQNRVVKERGLAEPVAGLPHWELIKKLGIVDFDLGTKITGAGFPIYIGKGARLQRALINFFLDRASLAGYVEVEVPVLVNRASATATGQLPDKDGQMYHDEKDDLYLVPTAEVPITNIYRDVVVPAHKLPVKHVGYTPCFRREAGSWGADTRGLNRLHQFDKVELVVLTEPEYADDRLYEMLKHVEGLLEELGLTYRVLKLCAGDLGFTAAVTYDFEVWSPAQEKWLEVSSVSSFDDYQANRLKCRYKGEDGRNHLLHTLNGSALALPRVLAALLEQNQEGESVRVPRCLHKYTGFDSI